MRPVRWLILGMAATGLTGVGWGLLSWMLAQAGHQPSGPAPLGADHYARQAPILPPLLVAAAWMGGAAAHRLLSRKHPDLPREGSAGALGLGLSLAFGLLFLLPDAVAYGLWGFAAMGRLLPLSGGLSLLAAWAAATLLLARAHGLPRSATVAPAALGLGVAVVVIALVAR